MFLIQVWVIDLVMRDTTWSWVPVLELLGWLVVAVTFQVDSVFERLVPVQPRLIYLA